MFMQSNFFTQCFILLLVLGALPATAQTPFWTETFSDEATSLANWTSGGENPGPENWKWSSDPSSAGFFNFAAPTASTGYMLFDSDANGLNEHAVTLTSPVIEPATLSITSLPNILLKLSIKCSNSMSSSSSTSSTACIAW